MESLGVGLGVFSIVVWLFFLFLAIVLTISPLFIWHHTRRTDIQTKMLAQLTQKNLKLQKSNCELLKILIALHGNEAEEILLSYESKNNFEF